jgi:hypothetical protein
MDKENRLRKKLKCFSEGRKELSDFLSYSFLSLFVSCYLSSILFVFLRNKEGFFCFENMSSKDREQIQTDDNKAIGQHVIRSFSDFEISYILISLTIRVTWKFIQCIKIFLG